jgi:hypothetical protein
MGEIAWKGWRGILNCSSKDNKNEEMITVLLAVADEAKKVSRAVGNKKKSMSAVKKNVSRE